MKPGLLIYFIGITVSASSQQLINGGFEDWDSAGRRPLHWSVSLEAALYHNPAGMAIEGSNCIVVSTWYSYVPGHLFYGQHNQPHYKDWAMYTVPFAGMPVKLTGYYRYTHTVNTGDKAMGELILKAANGDTLATGRVLLDTSGSWKKFEISIVYRSAGKAAGITIHFASVVKGGGMNDDSYPNRLYLDALQLFYKTP